MSPYDSALFNEAKARLKDGRIGEAEVSHFTVDRNASMISALRYNYVPPGEYVRLRVGGQFVMSDTPMERTSNMEVARRAHGRVLIFGLGLGMILGPILAKEDVESVLVVELSQDVIDLVGPAWAHHKLIIAQGDARRYWAEPGTFNVIYFDIWPVRDEANLPEMATLHRRAWRWLDRADPERWVGSWYQRELRAQRRRG